MPAPSTGVTNGKFVRVSANNLISLQLIQHPPDDYVPEPALNQKRQEIVHLLQKWGKPMSPQEIAAALGRDYTLIKQMLARIVRTDEVQKSDYGKYIVVLNSCYSCYS